MRFEKGKPIPLKPEEKLSLALQQAVSANEEWGDCAVWVTSFSVLNITESPMDEGKFRYKASGTASLGRKHKVKNMILMPLDVTFEINFADAKDHWSLPDVTVDQAKFKVSR